VDKENSSRRWRTVLRGLLSGRALFVLAALGALALLGLQLQRAGLSDAALNLLAFFAAFAAGASCWELKLALARKRRQAKLDALYGRR
jgi:hypothetical protein